MDTTLSLPSFHLSCHMTNHLPWHSKPVNCFFPVRRVFFANVPTETITTRGTTHACVTFLRCLRRRQTKLQLNDLQAAAEEHRGRRWRSREGKGGSFGILNEQLATTFECELRHKSVLVNIANGQKGSRQQADAGEAESVGGDLRDNRFLQLRSFGCSKRCCCFFCCCCCCCCFFFLGR